MNKLHLVNCRFIDNGSSSTIYTFGTIQDDLKVGDIVSSVLGGKMVVVGHTDKLPRQRLKMINKKYVGQLLPCPPQEAVDKYVRAQNIENEIKALKLKIAGLEKHLGLHWFGDFRE